MITVFSGCATALVTPMRNGAVDIAALERLIDLQTENGVTALVACGTTGEAPTLCTDEKQRVIAATVNRAAGKAVVIAGCGSPSTDFAAKFALMAQSEGADAVMCVTPYYNKATDEGVYLHYKAIADSISIPLIAYNVPSRTGMNISENTYEALCTIPNFAGVKEASSNIASAARIISRFGGKMHVYSGCDELCAPLYAVGGSGLISVASNIVPSAMVRLCSLCEKGKMSDAAALQSRLMPLISALFCELNPIPVKTALSMMNICSDEMRLPLCRMTASGRERLQKEMSAIGLL